MATKEDEFQFDNIRNPHILRWLCEKSVEHPDSIQLSFGPSKHPTYSHTPQVMQAFAKTKEQDDDSFDSDDGDETESDLPYSQSKKRVKKEDNGHVPSSLKLETQGSKSISKSSVKIGSITQNGMNGKLQSTDSQHISNDIPFKPPKDITTYAVRKNRDGYYIEVNKKHHHKVTGLFDSSCHLNHNSQDKIASALWTQFKTEGYIYLKGLLPVDEVLQAQKHMEGSLVEMGYVNMKGETAEKGWTIDAVTGTIISGNDETSDGLEDSDRKLVNKWKAVGTHNSIKNLRKHSNINQILQYLSRGKTAEHNNKSQNTANIACTPYVFKNMSWLRIKGPQGYTADHADITYMRTDTEMFTGSIHTAKGAPKHCEINVNTSSYDEDMQYKCNKCHKHNQTDSLMRCDECFQYTHVKCIPKGAYGSLDANGEKILSNTAWYCHECDFQHTIGTCWIPLGDVSVESGVLAILGGSTDMPNFYKLLKGSQSPASFQTDHAASKVWHTGAYQAGDVVIFDSHVMHATSTNITDKFRLSLDFRWDLVPQRPNVFKTTRGKYVQNNCTEIKCDMNTKLSTTSRGALTSSLSSSSVANKLQVVHFEPSTTSSSLQGSATSNVTPSNSHNRPGRKVTHIVTEDMYPDLCSIITSAGHAGVPSIREAFQQMYPHMPKTQIDIALQVLGVKEKRQGDAREVWHVRSEYKQYDNNRDKNNSKINSNNTNNNKKRKCSSEDEDDIEDTEEEEEKKEVVKEVEKKVVYHHMSVAKSVPPSSTSNTTVHKKSVVTLKQLININSNSNNNSNKKQKIVLDLCDSSDDNDNEEDDDEDNNSNTSTEEVTTRKEVVRPVVLVSAAVPITPVSLYKIDCRARAITLLVTESGGGGVTVQPTEAQIEVKLSAMWSNTSSDFKSIYRERANSANKKS